jgi:magnesium chelatase family protein
MVSRYRKRISGPLLDRIDIHVEVPRVDYEKLSSDPWQDFTLQGLRWLGEPSAAVRKRVEAARERQRARFAETSLVTNADIAQPPRHGDGPGRDLPGKCPLGILPGK